MSTNVSKQKRDELTAKLADIRTYISTAPQDENTERLLTYLGQIEKDVKGKKYGLVFEEHRESIDELLENHTPVLSEERDLFIDNGGTMNFLLEGDNLSALQLLLKTHKESIDVIYIDPPYNTEKDGFTYSDSRVDANDSFRHSKWLSFMKERISISRTLLSDKGVIFISVDENEFAQMKILCDEIFNENCFVECLIWNKRVPKNDKGIGNIHEYILLYAKQSDYKYKFMMPKDGLEDIAALMTECKKKKLSIQESEKLLRDLYKKKSYDRAITLYNAVDENYRVWGKINMSWPNGNTFGPRYDVLHPMTGNLVKVPDRGWRWSKETFNNVVDYDNVISRFDGSYICGGIWFSKKENMQPSTIKYLDEVDRMLLRSIISLKSDGSIELEKFFEEKSKFAYPKPVGLIELLIDSITYDNQQSTILDFFAGSGTTGQAIMKLNHNDGGERRFILCTNNENNICRDVTYERIRRVIDKEGYNASLKYYRVEYIPINEKFFGEIVDDLNLHIKELVELENGINFIGNAELAIILSDEEMDQFFESTTSFEKCLRLYKGYDVLLSGEQEETLKERGVEVVTIPNYYYRELEG